MPRMAAFFGLIAAMAGAIGLNIVRYPMVWEMVGTSAQLSQAGQSADTTAAAQPEPAPQSAAAAKPAAVKKPAQAHPSAQQKDATQLKEKEKEIVSRGPDGAGDHGPAKTTRAGKPKGKKAPPASHDKQTPVTPATLEREKPAPANQPQDSAPQDAAAEKPAAEKPTASNRAAERPPAPATPLDSGSNPMTSDFAATEAGGRLVPVVYPPIAQNEPQARPQLPEGMYRLPPADHVVPTRPDHLPPCRSGEPAPRYPSTGL